AKRSREEAAWRDVEPLRRSRGRGILTAVGERDIETLAELVRVVLEDPRFAGFQVSGRGEGYLEVRTGEGGVTLAEARLVKDPQAIEPHLVRSQNGSTMLILVGADSEFAGTESLRDRTDLALLSLPISRARLYVTVRNYLELVSLRIRSTERGRWVERYRVE